MRILLILLMIQQWLVTTYAVASNDITLRLHGSNTIGAELAPELVKGWFSKQGYKNLTSRELAPQEMIISAVDRHGISKHVEIKSHGSGTAFKSLSRGIADIGMASRPVKEKENNRLKSFGDMQSFDTEFVIGLDGIAVIVNKNNSVSSLEKNVIRQIFSGKITKWQQVDSSMTGPIQVYARDNKSGTFDTFKSLVLGKKTQLASTAIRYESNAILSDDVSMDKNGIGFVGLPYVRNAKALAVAEQGTLAKKPKVFDIATEDYALARRLYMYVPKEMISESVNSFLNFCQSEEGQHIVDRTGFISQNLRAEKVVLNPGFPQEYLQITENGTRLSLNFRFRKGTTKLDNKSLRDVKRLVEYLAKPANSNKKVMLFGFADSSESLPVFSLDLSTYRVDWVSDLLIKNGIDPVRVRAYGDAIPVASNEDPGGRHKNRRVEVWLQ